MCLCELARIWVIGITLFFAQMTFAAPAPKEKPDPKDSAQEETVEPAKMTILNARQFRTMSTNNLKQLSLAFINCADSNNSEVPNDFTDKDGKPLLSWRVRILPYIEQADLYKQFKLDELWDSENNLKLLEKMPKTFSSPRVSVKHKGFTVYQGFAGPGSAFEPGKKLKYPASFPDGTSNTILIGESSVAVPWTKPADIPFDPNKDLPELGKAYDSKPLVAMCDGSVRLVDTKKVSAKTLKAAITTGGGEILGDDW